MKVLVTGGTGFIGRNLILRLQKDEHNVVCATRSIAKAQQTLGGGIQYIDISQDDQLEQAVYQADAIINLAGEPVLGGRWNSSRKQSLRDSRVGITKRITKAILSSAQADTASTKKILVSASAIGFYGDQADKVLSEDSPCGQGLLAHICRDWEQAALDAQTAAQVTIVRIGVVLGLGGGVLKRTIPLFRAKLGGPLGSGKQYMPWIHIHDLLELLIVPLQDSRYTGIINGVAPVPVSNRHFAQELAQCLGTKARIPTPAFVLKAALGQASHVVLDSARVIPRRANELGFVFHYQKIRQALQNLIRSSCKIVKKKGRPFDNDYFQKRNVSYKLTTEVPIDAPIEEVFRFFSSASNLSVITPPSLCFTILTPDPITMGTGTSIDYRIRLGPFPMKWRTRIENWTSNRQFVDSQTKGPYTSWWHEHHFESQGKNTVVKDTVYYKPPLGILGRIANALFIRRQLNDIFSYRHQAMASRFGNESSE